MLSSHRAHHSRGGAALLLLAVSSSAAFSFQPSNIHHAIIASPRHRHGSSFEAATGSSIVGSKQINFNSQHLTKSRRMSSTSSTTLHLFNWNKKDEEEITPAIIEAEEEEDEPFIVKLASFLKVAFPSFSAGIIVTLGFLFLPLLSDYYQAFDSFEYNSASSSQTASSDGEKDGGKNSKKKQNMQNNVNQPVILFETILNDLNEAYVDDVDVQKLFETGVKAMTASLDPYTEFESRLEAQELTESVSGKYGGVGLVIRGNPNLKELMAEEEEMLDNKEKIETTTTNPGASPNTPSLDASPPLAIKDPTSFGNKVGDSKSNNNNNKVVPTTEEEDDEDIELAERRKFRKKSMEDGIRVVSAFEGYAYDAGFRVGDKLLAIDDFDITPTTGPDEVRNHLRGDPGTPVTVKFLREGVGGQVNEPQTITMDRAVVRIPDVKYFGFIGDPKDGIGYIDLSGFANDAGREVRFAIRALQHGAELVARKTDNDGSSMATTDPSYLKGLVLDLRSNPGGLLTSAVDVATLFVPHGSDVVSAKGRGFPEILYRSKTNPILDPSTRFAVLVNEQTASAAEIVSGAVQDLDVGVIVGKGRTFGKGLVQNVQDLPYQTALKYTVAKYYTPSGRCIQSTVYEEGSSADGQNGVAGYKSTKVADKDRNVFHTAMGREVKDGGGVEVDYKVEPQKASPLEIILTTSGTYSDYAAEWSKTHELTEDFKVDYKDFQTFIEKRQQNGDMKLEVLYDSQLKELQKKLKASRFDSSRKELDKLRGSIIKDVKKDFSTYKKEIIEDIEQNILARYLPDSMLIERGLRNDVQVAETAKMLKDGREFDRILARDEDSFKEKGSVLTNAGSQSNQSTSTMKPLPTLQSRWQ